MLLSICRCWIVFLTQPVGVLLALAFLTNIAAIAAGVGVAAVCSYDLTQLFNGYALALMATAAWADLVDNAAVTTDRITVNWVVD